VKKTILLFVLNGVLIYFSVAQTAIDSLRQVLKTQGDDSNKVNTYLQFFYTDLYYNDPAEVILLTKNAIELSKEIHFVKGEIEAYNSLGYIYRLRSTNDSAFYYFKKAKLLSESVNYTLGLLDAYIGIGNTYNQLSKWQEAIVEFQKAEEIALAAKNIRIAASANNNMGNISLAHGDLQAALKYYQKAADIGPPSIKEVALVNIGLVHIELNNGAKAKSYLLEAKEMTNASKNWYALAFIYQHLGSLEKADGNLEEALDYYQKAMNSYKSIDERQHYSEVLTSVASVYFDQQEYIKALSAYQESLDIQKEIEHFTGWCNSLHGIARVYLAMGKEVESEAALLQAVEIADNHDLLTIKDDIALTLSTLYKSKGQFEKALNYHELYKQLSDSLLNQQKSEQIAEMEAQFENRQKQQEIDLLSAENEIANLNVLQQTNFRNYVIIIAFILAILVAVTYNRVQVKVKANKKLQELDQLKTNFFTNISHEFRTPLTLILNPIEKVLKSQQDLAIRNDLLLVQRNGKRLLELTNQLLDLSKLEAGKLKLMVSEYESSEFFKTCVASFESFADSKNIKFKTKLKDAPKSAYFDQDNLQKILNNLLSNAFKFTPEGGMVELEVKQENTFMQISVRDSGLGISAEEQEKIFDRFHQETESRHQEGSGIGLTLTKELVLLHHGSITVESAPGQGSTFTVKIPISANAYASEQLIKEVPMNGKPSYSSESKAHTLQADVQSDLPIALVVEDNPDLRAHIIALLSGLYQLEQAPNGSQGLKMAMELIPDIIISDWMMPEMDGLEFCEKLKTEEKTSHIPIIMLTAKADLMSKIDGLKTGADDYLTKPFNTEELLVRMENLIKQREKLRTTYSNIITITPSQVEIEDPNEAFLHKILSIVEQHIGDAEFTVEKLQKEVGMSRMQLHRKLKALTNFSASEFVRDLRLQRAAQFLATNGISVADAAYSAGFNSLSYFSQCFKEKYGVTPSQFEKQPS